jgi:hypothetical protein
MGKAKVIKREVYSKDYYEERISETDFRVERILNIADMIKMLSSMAQQKEEFNYYRIINDLSVCIRHIANAEFISSFQPKKVKVF